MSARKVSCMCFTCLYSWSVHFQWNCRTGRSEEHTSELQSHLNLVCRLLLEKKKKSRSYPIARVITDQSTSRVTKHVAKAHNMGRLILIFRPSYIAFCREYYIRSDNADSRSS